MAEQRSDEGGCDPPRRGGSTLRSPQASVAQRRPHLAVTQASHAEVRVLPGALHVPVAQRISASASEAGGRPFESGRGRHGARLAGGGRRPAKPPGAGFDFLVRLPARRPRDQGSGVLSRLCAFESRRADGGAHADRAGPGRYRPRGTVTSQDDEGQCYRRCRAEGNRGFRTA